MINIERLREKLNRVMDDKKDEANMASFLDINCKIPDEVSGFLTDFLKLETQEEELLGQLFKLTPDQITILATLVMIANGRTADFIRLERNMIALKLSVTDYIASGNMDYRKTSVDEGEKNPEAMLDALIRMREIVKKAHQDEKELD